MDQDGGTTIIPPPSLDWTAFGDVLPPGDRPRAVLRALEPVRPGAEIRMALFTEGWQSEIIPIRFDERARPCELALLGHVVERVPPEGDRRHVYIRLDRGGAMEVVLAEAHVPGGHALVRVRYPLGADHVLLLRPRAWKEPDLEAAGKITHWLENWRPSRAMSPEDALEEAVQFGLEWLADNPGAESNGFTFEQLRRRRSTGPDALKKWMKDKHFGIRQVQRELQRRISRSG